MFSYNVFQICDKNKNVVASLRSNNFGDTNHALEFLEAAVMAHTVPTLNQLIQKLCSATHSINSENGKIGQAIFEWLQPMEMDGDEYYFSVVPTNSGLWDISSMDNEDKGLSIPMVVYTNLVTLDEHTTLLQAQEIEAQLRALYHQHFKSRDCGIENIHALDLTALRELEHVRMWRMHNEEHNPLEVNAFIDSDWRDEFDPNGELAPGR